MINPFKSRGLVTSTLTGKSLRNRLISSNLANIDTPFYKAGDVESETALVHRANEIFKKDRGQKLELTKTSGNHQKPWRFPDPSKSTTYLRDGRLARSDANTVDLDVETTEMSKNTVIITALDEALKRQSNIFGSIIDTSSKLS